MRVVLRSRGKELHSPVLVAAFGISPGLSRGFVQGLASPLGSIEPLDANPNAQTLCPFDAADSGRQFGA